MAHSYQSQADDRTSAVEDRVQQFRKSAEDAAGTVAAEGAKALRSAGETAENAVDATKRFVQSQPLLAIGAVAVFACALGALWKLAPARRDANLIDRVSDYVEPHYRALRKHI
jgi:TP901 family phage tail tape measure protein